MATAELPCVVMTAVHDDDLTQKGPLGFCPLCSSNEIESLLHPN